MSNLSKIFDSLKVVLHTAELRENLRPVQFIDLTADTSMLVHLIRGRYFNEDEEQPMALGSYYFRPAGSTIDFRIGQADHYLTFRREQGMPNQEERDKFQRALNPNQAVEGNSEVFEFVSFEVLLHNTFHLFKILQLPRIPLPFDDELAYLIRELCREHYDDKLGRERLLKNYTEEMVIRIIRYIASLPQYEKNLEKINFLGDKRLAAIVEYIRENMGGDLSNRRLAQVTFLSEDYIGQFFKTLTNQSLQEYVENQRLEMALQKLNSTTDSVSEIAFSVGFKDPAYFSRRFKMRFNVNANTIRNAKSTLSD